MFNDSYTVVHKIKHATKIESGLFKFLSQTKYHTVQDYILINLACINNLYDILNMDGYVISNRHIRIDRFFVKPNTLLSKQKLLSHWHYTEEYKHADKPSLKLHVYFNHALFLLACIHRKNGSFSEITDKFALAKIRMNTYEAEQIVNGFLKELTNYRMHLEAEFNTLLGRFELGNVNDLIEKEFVAYIDLCKQKFAELSSYMEDRIDKRAHLLEENLKKLRADYKNLMQETRNKAQTKIDSSLSQKCYAIVKTEQPTAPLSKQRPITQILKNAKLFIEKYNAKHNAKQLLELMTEKELILGELLQNWQEDNSRHGATFRFYIEQIHNLPSIYTKILDLALEGRVSDIKFLFNHEHTHPYMQLKFFYQFLTLCYMSKSSEAIVELCIFFYEYAPEYREYLSIFPHLPMQKDLEYVSLFPLVRIAQQNNFALFKLLIEQINMPHIVGACFDNKCMSLIHYLLANDYEIKYIQVLLDASIVAENLGFASFYAGFSDLIKNVTSACKHNEQLTKIPPIIMQDLACYDSAFVVGCHRLLRDNDILPLLLNMAKQANAINLLLGVASFIKNIPYRIDFIQTEGALKVVNMQEFYAKEQAVTKTDEDFARYMQITFANDFLLQSNFVAQILEMVRDNVLKENVTDDELYEEHIRHLLAFAMEQERVRSINNAIAAYYAQLILLCATTPTIKHQTNILNILLRIIQLNSLPQESKEGFKHVRICQRALSTLIQHSPFKTILTADPRFKIRIDAALKAIPQIGLLKNMQEGLASKSLDQDISNAAINNFITPNGGIKKASELWLAVASKQWALAHKLLTNKISTAAINFIALDGELKGLLVLWLVLLHKQWSLAHKLLTKDLSEEVISAIAIYKGEKGISTLWLMVSNQQWSLAHKLLAKVISKNAINSIALDGKYEGISVLWLAIYFGQSDLANELLEKDLSEEAINSIARVGIHKGKSVLWLAIANGLWDLVNKLLEKDLSEEVINSIAVDGEYKGISVLWLAVNYNHLDLASKLLAKELSNEAINSIALAGKAKGISTFWLATANGLLDLANELLAEGINEEGINSIALEGEHKGISVLWWTVYYEQWDLANELLTKGINKEAINCVALNGENKEISVLWWVFAGKQWDLANKLLAKEMSKEAINSGKDGQTILDLAKKNHQYVLVERLIELLKSQDELDNCLNSRFELTI